MSSAEQGPLWLVRNQEIADHLADASREQAPATVSAVGLVEAGHLGFQNPGQLIFSPNRRLRWPQPDSGARVRVDYRKAGDAFRFYSRLSRVERDGLWVITLPRTVERRDLRRTPRHLLDPSGAAAFRVREMPGDPILAVYDLSVDGVALVFEGRTAPPCPGDVLAGLLNVSGLPEMAVHVEVRNIRNGPRPGTVVAGCRFGRIAVADRLRLDWFLNTRVETPAA